MDNIPQLNSHLKSSYPITVLMSVYNGETWIRKSIESIINQTFEDFEFLIIDDGSIDETKYILEEFSKKDSRIKIVYKENSGLTNSLNYGLSIAKGTWIARIDADDIALPNRLELQYQHISQSEKNIVLLGSFSKIRGPHNDYDYVAICPLKNKNLHKNLLNMRSFFSHSSAFFKLEAAKKVGLYRDRLKKAQDFDLWIRLTDVGEIECLSKALVIITKHENQISNINFGVEQYVNAHLSLLSYHIREDGEICPIDNDSRIEQFKTFKKWTENQLHKHKKIEYFIELQKIKKKLKSSSVIENSFKFFHILIFDPAFFIWYFNYKFFGEKTIKEVYRDWQYEFKKK